MVATAWAGIYLFLYSKYLGESKRTNNVTFFILGFINFGFIIHTFVALGINNSITIYRDTSAQITNQQRQQTIQLQKLNQQLNTADTPLELNTIAKIINPDDTVNAPTQELKNNLKQQIQTAVQSMSHAASIAKRQQSINLIKDAVRVNLGTLLAGAGLITVWNLTRWARTFDKDVN